MTLATGVGSFPGVDQRDFDEALRIVVGELGDHAGLGIPFLPEVPGRGAAAGMVGRTVGLLTELDADLQPAGWRLTGTAGAPPVDQRRARSLLTQDLDGLEEQLASHPGPVKVQVAGPWTLAATVERPRGDRLLADHGARRELAQALALAVAAHVADVRRRVPDADRVIVQVDEPALPGVMAGRVPTASGFGRHRTVQAPEASEALGWVLDAVRGAGAEPWVHCCAQGAPLALLRRSGATALAVDLSVVGADGNDVLAEALEAGETVVLGVIPTAADGAAAGSPVTGSPVAGSPVTPLVERVLRWLDLVGLDPATVGRHLVVSPACGLAGADPAWARQAIELSRAVATALRG